MPATVGRAAGQHRGLVCVVVVREKRAQVGGWACCVRHGLPGGLHARGGGTVSGRAGRRQAGKCRQDGWEGGAYVLYVDDNTGATALGLQYRRHLCSIYCGGARVILGARARARRQGRRPMRATGGGGVGACEQRAARCRHTAEDTRVATGNAKLQLHRHARTLAFFTPTTSVRIFGARVGFTSQKRTVPFACGARATNGSEVCGEGECAAAAHVHMRQRGKPCRWDENCVPHALPAGGSVRAGCTAPRRL